MSTNTLAAPSDAALLTDGPDATDLEQDLLATLEPLGRAGRVWIASLLTVCAMALVAWIYQLANGLRVTDMRNYVSWGAYMTNLVVS